ncbi:MAG: triple tyrosine motif-containing protein [Flavobacterium sp.]|uniref:triple tyrosine motif-containing protein n=1 Tax=Flavobacterium sp. TaxID=239 RepID=UPI0026041C6C|nr:triple tyrosine motif-containing protein [Flavobacterium sp.]MDD5149862.1 triple tyrosine motif-containing protein [Flavobacterium sp.]
MKIITKTHCLFIVFGLFLSSLLYSQTKNEQSSLSAIPSTLKIIHFTRNDFKADPQFLTMCENEDGTLIFGNNDGAIIFDGEHWQKVSLPNNSSVSSLAKTSSGKVYVGGYNELGTLQKNKFGNYFYKSLVAEFHLEDKNLENLWQVREFKNHIIYRTFSELIVITGDRVTLLPANKSFIYSEKVRDHYFVQDAEFGIYEFDAKTTSLFPVFDVKSILNENINAILPTTNPDIFTIISRFGNVYTGNIKTKIITKKLSLFDGTKKDIVSYGILGNNNDYLIGTRSSKIITLTANGKIIRENPLFSGLSSTTIHCIFQTKNQNIWILQSNGLSLLDYKSPFISVFDQSSVYGVLVKNKIVYLATSNGVYFSDFLKNSNNNNFNFKKIENLQGSSWAIQELDNDIIVSHDAGLFKIENENAQKIGSEDGFWKMTKIKNKKGFYLGSNYSGLYLIKKVNNNWTIKNKIKGFEESSRDILADYKSETYWVCHGYKGVYKIHINPDYSRVDAVDHFTNKNGFKSPFNINVFNWDGKIVFTTNDGIYTYNEGANKFELFNTLNSIFDPSINTRKLLESNGKTWFVQDDEAGYFIDKNPTLYKDIFLNLKGSFNRGMECIYPLDNNTVMFGTNAGLYLYTLAKNRSKNIFPTNISQIIYTQNQKLKNIEISSKENNIQLPNQTDILRFEFSSPKMFSSSEIQYSYKLENVDQNWSTWQKSAYKEYTHLRPDSYTFVVKSRNLAGQLGEETRFEFNILPKWYQTNFAYFIYIIFCFSFIYYVINYVKKRIAYEQLKSKIEIKKSQQLLELEIEKLKLKQDKEAIYKDKLSLEGDIINKSKELANYTISLSKKKEVFDELKNDLSKLRELLKSQESKKKITEIFQKLNQHRIGEEYIEIFDVNFEKINHNFFEKLKQLDSTLTKRELRLCAFVKMDLTNKEIAPLLNISIRGVESARYRVRKKLNVQYEDNFMSFLENLAENS